MRIRISLLMSLYLFLAFSCQNNINNIEEQKNFVPDTTQMFKDYLKSTFNKQILMNKHRYLIITATGCRQCIEQLVQSFTPILKEIDSSTTTIIVANENYFKHFDTFHNLNAWIDSFNVIDEYALGLTNVCMVYTSQNKVDSIKKFKWGDELTLVNLLKLSKLYNY